MWNESDCVYALIQKLNQIIQIIQKNKGEYYEWSISKQCGTANS